MKYALNIGEGGRILSATFEKYASAEAVLVDELPEGNVADYRYENGKYVYDPLPKAEEEEPGPTLDERVKTLEDSSAEMTEALDMILSGVTE